jgi:protein-tyrosine phosphatase
VTQIFEVVPGLALSGHLFEPDDFASLGVDAIVDLEHRGYSHVPAVEAGTLYVSFPIEDDEIVDPRVPVVARFVADLVQGGQRVLVHCTQGFNRAGVVVARALMEMGMSAQDAIGLVRSRRGLDEEGFGALGNEDFVRWLGEQELGRDRTARLDQEADG